MVRNINFKDYAGSRPCQSVVTNIRLANYVIGDAENRGTACIIPQPTASGQAQEAYTQVDIQSALKKKACAGSKFSNVAEFASDFAFFF